MDRRPIALVDFSTIFEPLAPLLPDQGPNEVRPPLSEVQEALLSRG